MNHFVPTLVTEDLNHLSKRAPQPIKIKSSADLELPLSDGISSVGESECVRPNAAAGTAGFFENQIVRRFGEMKEGRFTVESPTGIKQLGSESNDKLSSKIAVSNNAFFKRVFLGGTIGAAESYMDGEWASTDLTALIRIMIRNLGTFSKLEKTWAMLKNRWYFVQHLFNRNTVNGSRKNIHEHYDLGNDFYKLFLDPTMNYSSGIFSTSDPDSSDRDEMEAASFRKMEEICKRLELSPEDHVLEIGTGWGGLSMHMAKYYGCRVTTTTISQEQFKLANERILDAGMEDRIDVLLKDYRDLSGEYDKIVSVEMIEAVGHQFYDVFFEKCSSLLAPEGKLFLQAITIGEQIFDYHIKHVDFIRKYVFPGGCLPSITALSKSVGRVTNMRMTHQMDIAPHYVKTLAFWRRKFMSKLEQVRMMGYSDKFIRLWHFYLCYCEAAFAEERVHCVHLMWSKPKR